MGYSLIEDAPIEDPNGLLHMRARYYSPELRRFINSDPARFDGGLNWYAYANNSPLLYVDASGEVAILALPLIIGGYFLGTTQTANAPGPRDITTNNAPLLEASFAAGGLATGIGPASSLGRTMVGSGLSLADDVATQGAFIYGAGSSIVRTQSQRILASAVTNPNLGKNVGRGLLLAAGAGAVNQRFDFVETNGLNGVDFAAGGPIGTALNTGITAFNAGGALAQGTSRVLNFAHNRAIPTANNFFNSFGFSGSLSSRSKSIFNTSFNGLNPIK